MPYHDINVNMSVGATVLRGYLGKVSQKVRVSSKNPTYNYNSTGGTHCRETCASQIRDGVIKAAAGVNGKSYYVLPVASMVNKKGTVFCGKSSLHMSVACGKEIPKQDVKDAMNYTLGIMGVLFCSDEGEARRRRRKIGTADAVHVSISKGTPNDYLDVDYDVLSPLWLITPVTVSLVLGVMRNMLSLSINNRELLNKKLFSKVSRHEVESIINSCDRAGAMRVYKKVILPFFDDVSICGNNSVYLSRDGVRKLIQPIIVDGLKAHLNPEKTSKYWTHYDSHYGISACCQDRNTFDKIDGKC